MRKIVMLIAMMALLVGCNSNDKTSFRPVFYILANNYAWGNSKAITVDDEGTVYLHSTVSVFRLDSNNSYGEQKLKEILNQNRSRINKIQTSEVDYLINRVVLHLDKPFSIIKEEDYTCFDGVSYQYGFFEYNPSGNSYTPKPLMIPGPTTWAIDDNDITEAVNRLIDLSANAGLVYYGACGGIWDRY